MIRHYNMHKKRDNSLQHGFMRFSPLDDCSVYYHGCHLNGKSTHYHCMQVPGAGSRGAGAWRESGGWQASAESRGHGPLVVSGRARAGPSPWPYLVWVQFRELFIQTNIFQALTPRGVLQMVPEEVFV